MEKLIKKIKINKTITLLTGLHIGGSSENVEIGGIDSPVIKIAVRDNQPYIPGSSVRGKMRCLLEQVRGAAEIGDAKDVNDLFGFSNNNIKSRLIVRDAYLTEESNAYFLNCETLDMPYTEGKWENTINRVDGSANPRQIERVPAGAVFSIEFIVNIWENDDEAALLAMVEEGIALIENDYLGGNGSRGYGQVKFTNLGDAQYLTSENNWKA